MSGGNEQWTFIGEYFFSNFSSQTLLLFSTVNRLFDFSLVSLNVMLVLVMKSFFVDYVFKMIVMIKGLVLQERITINQDIYA